jgi:hypothetical protein
MIREEFGAERVIDCCRGLAGALSAEQLVESLMQAAASWSAGAEHFDDDCCGCCCYTVTAGVDGRFFLVVRSVALCRLEGFRCKMEVIL